jgi:hypothetical protein
MNINKNIATSTCDFSNPQWILKTGAVRTLEPLSTAGTNANFQFGSSTCSIIEITTSTSPIDNYSGGEIVNSVLIFWIFLSIILGFFVARFLGIAFIRKH